MPSRNLADRLRALLSDHDRESAESSPDVDARLTDIEAALAGIVDLLGERSPATNGATPAASTQSGDGDAPKADATPAPTTRAENPSDKSIQDKIAVSTHGEADGAGGGATPPSDAATPAGSAAPRGAWTADQVSRMPLGDVVKNLDSITAQLQQESR